MKKITIINGKRLTKEHLKTLEKILINAFEERVLNLELFKILEYFKIDKNDLIMDLLMDGSNELDINIFNNIYYKQLKIDTSDIFEEYTKIVHNL